MAKSGVNSASTFGLHAAVATSFTLAVLGCTGNSATDNPVALEFSEKVMRRHDKNSDGLLTAIELRGADGIRGHIKEEYDRDGDGKTSRDEIASRIDSWLKEGPTVQVVDITVTLDGSPLAGATVQMVPDFDPGDNSQAKAGQTDATGAARIEVTLEDLSQALDNPDFRGVFASNYLVEVTHPQRKILARYNADTGISVNVPREATGTKLLLELNSD